MRGQDLTRHDVLFWGVARRYAIVYRKAKPLQIVRVLAWRRDIKRVLEDALGSKRS